MDVDPDGVDFAGTHEDTYLSRAATLLADGDDRLTTARDTWVEFVRATTGDALADLDLATPAPEFDLDSTDRAFLATCYYDFVIETAIDAVEGECSVTVQNRSAALGSDLRRLHDVVLPPAQRDERVHGALSEATLDALDPGALDDLYRAVVPRPVRLALGEYYTPRGIADLAVEAVEGGRPDRRVLDPGCGAGVFLTAAIDAKRAEIDATPSETVDTLLDTVVGIDLNPVAVKSAKLAYLLAMGDLLDEAGRSTVTVPVYLADAVGLTIDDAAGRFDGSAAASSFDTLVGNPPWIPWERLPDQLKTAWREGYVADLGLQPHEGIEARLGHSNDDISVPFAFACIHRYLRAGGRAAFVLKRDIVRGPAGAVLRRAQVGDRSLRVEEVHDFADTSPFPDADAGAAVYVFAADETPRTPVPTTVWKRRDDSAVSFASVTRLRETARTLSSELVPLDESERTSTWVRADLAREALGTCQHDIRHGLKDDAAAVFGLDRSTLAEIERDRVFPYLRSRHVRKFGLTGHDLRLVPADRAGEDNEAWLREHCPSTYDYLADHRERLLDRSSSWLDAGPFYTQFGLGPYTWEPYKVVWCRLGFKPDFAVASTRTDPDLGEKPVVPGDHYMFVATDDRREAHFLCALLNSAPYQRTLRTLASGGKASLSKSVVSELALPTWPGTDRAEELAACSMRLHDLVAAGAESEDGDGPTARVEDERARIDDLVRAGIEAGEFGIATGGRD
jgi:SAM-dependent methyltransferase